MNCLLVNEYLLDYLEGGMEPATKKDVEAHLAECSACREELQRWRCVEAQVGRGIETLVANERPGRSVTAILRAAPNLKAKRPRRLLGLVAAGVAAILILSPLFVPFSARVLASTPVIGGYFATAIAESGLAVAYQAGLVTELNQSVSDQGMTLSVIGAYADATQTTVMFSISGEKERMKQLWEEMPRTREQVSLRDSLGREYAAGHSSRSGYFDEETGQYHVFLETSALPFYVGRLKLRVSMQGQAIRTDWSTSFPVQRVSDRLVKELQVDREFTTADGYPVRVEKLVFSPSRTVLHYSMQRPDTTEMAFPRWSVLADGQPLASLGGGGGGGSSRYTGTAAFFPTNAHELTLRFDGMMGSYVLDWRLQMESGASVQWHDIVFTLRDARVENGGALVHAQMESGFIKIHDPVLELGNGTKVTGKVLDFEPDADGGGGVYELHFPGVADLSQATMIIDRAQGILPDPWSTTVRRP